MPRRLAICFEFPTLSGGERSMLAVLEAPPPPGWEVVLLAPGDGPVAQAAAAIGLDVVDWRLRENGHKPPPEWAAESLRQALAGVAADSVHANSLSLARVTGRLARDRPDEALPSTGHLRDIMRLSRAALADLAANTQLLAVSPAVHNAFATQSDHLGEQITVVPNGIAPLPACPLNGDEIDDATDGDKTLRSELAVPPGIPLFATIGQIGLRKGHDLARDALALLAGDAKQPVDFRWLVIGERFSQKAESVAYEAALSDGLGDRVRRLGYRQDVPAILRQVDLLLHPARQEPFGRVLLEAAEAGCPVVGFEVGGNRFSLPRSRLVPLEGVSRTDAVAGLAAAIRASLADPIREAAGRFPIQRCRERTWAIWQAAAEA